AGSGAVSVSGSVAVALATNTISDTVTARVDGSKVSSTSAKISATSTADSEAFATGVSVAVAAGSGAGAIALGGWRPTHNGNMPLGAPVLASPDRANVEAKGVFASTGDVEISATDTSTINSVPTTAAVAASVGAGSFDIAVGAAVAVNNVGNQGTAKGDGSPGAATLGAVRRP